MSDAAQNMRTDGMIDAFVDGELDLPAQLAMEQRLTDDAALRRRVDDARSMRDAVRDSADYHAAPNALKDWAARMAVEPSTPSVDVVDATVAATFGPTPAQPLTAEPPRGSFAAQPPSRPQRARGASIGDTLTSWLAWRPLAASLAFAVVMAVGINLLWLKSSTDDRLAEEVVASHVRSSLGQHLVDVSSADHHTVKPFLSARLGYSPPVDELQVTGSSFLGGRVDYLDGRPVAALVYRQGQHLVNSFVWPSKARDSDPTFGTDQGFRMAHWTRQGMTHWVISDVNAQEFGALVQAVEASSRNP